MAGNQNANMVNPKCTIQAEAIADELMAAGMMDMGLHLLPRCKPWLKDRLTWRIQRDIQQF